MITSTVKQSVKTRISPIRKRQSFKLIVKGRKRFYPKQISAFKAFEPKLVKPGFILQVAIFKNLLKNNRKLFLISGLSMLFCLSSLFIFVRSPIKDLALPPLTDILETKFMEIITPTSEQQDQLPNVSNQFRRLKIKNYKIKNGETLPELAKRNGLDLDTIISFNNIKDVYALKAGQVLKLPNHSGLLYQVKAGDSLGKISKNFKVSVDELLDWNDLPSSVITVGQKLFIPGAKLNPNELNRVLGRLFIWPVRGEITSYFGMRLSPITGTKIFHGAIDIANKLGTPIVAVMPGKVAIVDYNAIFGNYLILVHPEGFQTLYAHCEKILVKKGQQVAQGEKIALMGNSGASTGCHLHFAIFKNGREVNPLIYLK